MQSPVCLPVARVSRECSGFAYPARAPYHNGDRIVRRIHRLIRRAARTRAASGACTGAMRALACASVFPDCRARSNDDDGDDDDNDEGEGIPGYARLLHVSTESDVSAACSVPVDGLSQRLVESLERDMGGAAAAAVARTAPYEREMALLDVLSFAAFALVVWYLGFCLVRQWNAAMAVLRRPPSLAVLPPVVADSRHKSLADVGA
ncbi:hypothetical protein H4R18_002173 [Coemansia javaensis]|uniref:Uncharacterized protein n=1 Tax=Coemansia javaensis TaxID=2761396 RepID=A0A9W8HIE6_9FUNG|nr:hypothetical protein H4R18_002173 [Coemansia javaensis]